MFALRAIFNWWQGAPADQQSTYFKLLCKDLLVYTAQFILPNQIDKLSYIPEYKSIMSDSNDYLFTFYWHQHIGGSVVSFCNKYFYLTTKGAINRVYSDLADRNIEEQLKYCVDNQLIIHLRTILRTVCDSNINSVNKKKIYGKCYYWNEENHGTIYHSVIKNICIQFGDESELQCEADNYYQSIRNKGPRGPRGISVKELQRREEYFRVKEIMEV